jgi:methionyl-tRNA formyltransferase
VGAELLSETLARLGEIEPRAQREEDATHAPMLKREDGLIDWTQDASEIERRVRGFQPWPNAHTTRGGRRLILWSAEPFKIKEEEGAPAASEGGIVVEAHGDELVVACGGVTALRVYELQPEGKQRMRARDFINGMRVRVGERLGE